MSRQQVKTYKLKRKNYFQDWENESTPLEPKGKGPPKFIGPVDKHSCNEGTQILFQRIYTE